MTGKRYLATGLAASIEWGLCGTNIALSLLNIAKLVLE